jgi:hypothetical protein
MYMPVIQIKVNYMLIKPFASISVPVSAHAKYIYICPHSMATVSELLLNL